MSSAHNSWTDVPRRAITEEERKWVQEIVSANPDWADVTIGELHVVKQCTCGCRSVVLEEPSFVQNPKFSQQQGLIGEIDIHVYLEDGKDDYVSVLLHQSRGKLTYMEVIWYNFPEPVPLHWIEIRREVRVGG
jgi:hypothetical protein